MIYVVITNKKSNETKVIDVTHYNMLQLEKTIETYESTNRFSVEIFGGDK